MHFKLTDMRVQLIDGGVCGDADEKPRHPLRHSKKKALGMGFIPSSLRCFKGWLNNKGKGQGRLMWYATTEDNFLDSEGQILILAALLNYKLLSFHGSDSCGCKYCGENIFCIMHKNTQRNTSENKVIKSMKKLFNTSTFI